MSKNEHPLQLKQLANTCFKKQKYKEAVKLYSKALSSQKAKLPDDNRLRAVLLANRAAALMKYTPPQYKRALEDCTQAIEVDRTYNKALYRQARAHEGQATKLGLASGGVDHLEKALLSLKQLFRNDPDNKEAVSLAQRIREKLIKAQEDLRTPSIYIKKIRAGMKVEDGDVAKDIRIVMSLFHTDLCYTQLILKSNFCSLLLKITFLPDSNTVIQKQPNLRPEASRALTSILNKLQEPKSDSKDSKSDPDDTESSTPVSFSTKDISSLKKMTPKIITLVKELELNKKDHDKAKHDHYRMLIALLGRISANVLFEEYRKQILEQLLRCLALLPPKKEKVVKDKRQRKQKKKKLDGTEWSLNTLATVGCALQAIAVMANSDKNALDLARRFSLPILLFSKIAKIKMLRRPLIGCLAVICESESLIKKSKGSDDKFDKLNKMNKKMEKVVKEKLKEEGKEIPEELKEEENKDTIIEERFKQTLAKFIFAPLMTDHPDANEKAVRGFSLIVQSHPQMGAEMLKFRFKEISEKCEKAKVAIKQRRKDAMTPEEKEMEEEGVLKEPKEEEGISALQMLLFLCGEPNEEIKLAAAEVLALCSTDTHIRDTIVDSGNATLFFNHLLSPNFMVRSQSGLAVSKLAAIGTIHLEKDQHIGVVAALMEGLTIYQEQKKEKEKQKKNKEKEKKNDDHEDYDIIDKYIDRDVECEVTLECVRHLIESLAYLSLNIKSKQAIISEDGVMFKTLTALVEEEDTAIRYGVSQIVYNLTVSSEDLMKNYDKEIEELRKIAAKGLPQGAQEKKEELAKKAGSPSAIQKIRKKIVKYGAVSSFMKLWKRYREDFQEKKDKGLEEDKPKKKKKKEKKRILSYEAQKKETDEPIVISEKAAESIANALMNMSTEPSNRGKMVQEGALQLLLHLFRYEKKEIWTDSAIAISRIGISTNPNLFSHGVVYSLVDPLLHLIRTADHELYQFEATLSLTNIASIDDQIRNNIMNEKGWTDLQGLLASDNHDVQRAAIECLTNLVSCEKAMERLRGPAGDNDIRFFLIFARAIDDPKAQSAATGALAMVSYDKVIAKKIATCVLTSTQYDSDDEGDEEERKGHEITRTGMEILEEVVANPKTNQDVLTRVKVCIDGIKDATKTN